MCVWKLRLYDYLMSYYSNRDYYYLAKDRKDLVELLIREGHYWFLSIERNDVLSSVDVELVCSVEQARFITSDPILLPDS